MLGAGTPIEKSHLQDEMICHLSHLFTPSSELAKLIWEAHYNRVARHFGMEKIVAILL
jgi:hypothetical protein